MLTQLWENEPKCLSDQNVSAHKMTEMSQQKEKLESSKQAVGKAFNDTIASGIWL